VADERVETVGQALRGVTSDPAWLKRVAIGALVTLIPYVGAVWLMGYGLHYQRGLAWGGSERLPEWRPAEPHLRTGLYAFVVAMVYSLPLSVLLSVGFVVLLVPATVAVGDRQPGVEFFVTMAVASLLFTAVTLFLASFLWPVYVHVNRHDRLEAGFQVRRIFELAREHSRTFWTAFWRTLGLTALSMTVSFAVFGLIVGGGVALVLALLPRDMIAVGIVAAVLPLELVAFALTSLVGVFFGLAGYRLWSGYARVAYPAGGEVPGYAPAPAPVPATGV